jgi:membrane protease YdiL (CAAX protease family)
MSKKSFPEPVEALLLILAILVGIVILTLFFSILIGINLEAQDFEKNARFIFIFGGSLFIIVPYTYSRIKKYEIRPLFRLNAVPAPIIFLSVLCGVSLSIVGDELDRLVNIIIPIPEWILEQMKPLQVESGLDWVLIITGAVIVASIAEEGLFRGFFQVTLEKKGDATRAVLLSAITWTIIHLNPYWAIQIFITGIIIGFLAWRTDSIIPSIIVHAVNNLLALLFLNFNLEEVLSWYLWGGHVAPFVLVIAAGGLVWSLREINAVYQRD